MNHNIQLEDPRGLNPKIIIALVVVLILFAVGYFVFRDFIGDFSDGGKEKFITSALPELNKEPKKRAPSLKEGSTFLLIGTDKRFGSQEKWGRSDTILLLRISKQARAVSLLSLPRDLLVDIPGYGQDKINAAYSYGGPGLLIATVREYLGVPINHFFQISFDGFAEIIYGFPEDSVYLPVDGRYYHSNEGLAEAEQWSEIDLRPGYQALGAEEALSFVRFRHLDSDFHRAARQQLFLREVARQVYAQAGGDIASLQNFARAVARAGTSDFDSLSETLSLVSTLRKISPSRLLRLTLSGNEGLGSTGSYYINPSPREKAKILRLWSNPEIILDKQKSRAPLQKNQKELLTFLENINSWSAFIKDRPLEKKSTNLLSRWQEALARKGSRVEKKEKATVDLTKNPAAEDLLKSPVLNTCRPEELPSGYSWPEEARHSYKLAGYPALALYATRGSGDSILWMWSNWAGAPILENPDDSLRIGKKQYFLFWESGNLRTISWNIGKTKAWISNTLQNELSAKEMIALAQSCR